MEGIHIALSAEKLTEAFGIPITNTLITSWIVIGLLVILALTLGKKAKMIPGRIQVLFEFLFSWVMDYMEEVLEDKKLALRYFPLIVTIFLFIFTANLIEFTPGIGSVGFFETVNGETVGFTPLLRSVNTDLNVTLALAIISFLVIEFSGVFLIGFLKYFSKFVNVKSGAVGLVVGFLELFSELARLIAFSFRLFGNIFAGEVLILVIIFFLPYIAPVPLMLFEVFVGLVQAAIFALLTLFFIKIAVTEPH